VIHYTIHRNEEKYKELKSHYPMDQIPSANPNMLKCLIWVAIQALKCSRRILRLIRNANQENANRYTHFRLRRMNLKDYMRKRKKRLKNWCRAFLTRRLKGSCELPLFLIIIHSDFCYGGLLRVSVIQHAR